MDAKLWVGMATSSYVSAIPLAADMECGAKIYVVGLLPHPSQAPTGRGKQHGEKELIIIPKKD